MKRLGIYFFYDKDGIIDDYIPYMLKNIRPFCEEVCFVSNGKINQGKEGIEPFIDVCLERENKGFDVGAYKDALFHYGWEKLAEYDEVIMMNYTLFGPVYPFDEMFATMDAKKDLDFWGITKHHGVAFNPWKIGKYQDCIPEHIQSSFLVIRKNMIESSEYQNFIEELPEINSYEESICLYEIIFMEDFKNIGFKSGLYIDTSDLEGLTWYPLMKMAKHMVQSRKCPVFKVKGFSDNYMHILLDNYGDCSSELFEFLKNETTYDTDLVIEHTIRTGNLSNIQNLLHLTTIIPENDNHCDLKNAGLVLNIDNKEYLSQTIDILNLLNDSMDVLVITSNSNIKKNLNSLGYNKIKLSKVPYNDMNALFFDAENFVNKYKYIGFINAEKVDREVHGATTLATYKKNIICLAKSLNYIKNIVALFEEDKFCGMIIPPRIWHGIQWKQVGHEWQNSFQKVSEKSNELGLSAMVEQNLEPMLSFNSAFWIKSEILKSFLSLKELSSDLKNNPENKEYIRRILPFAVQSAGKYCRIALPQGMVSVEIDSSYKMLRELGSSFDEFGVGDFHAAVCMVRYIKAQNVYVKQKSSFEYNCLHFKNICRILKQYIKKKIIKIFFRNTSLWNPYK